MKMLEKVVLNIFGWEKSRSNEGHNLVDIRECLCTVKETFVTGQVPGGCEGWDLKASLGYDHMESLEYQATVTFIGKEVDEVKG